MSDIATSDSLHGAARASRGVSAQKIAEDAASEPSDSSGFWWRLAGVAWVAAVLSFVWGRYDLPFSGEAWAVARERIASADWMLILAAILAPLVLLWVLASLLRGSRRLSAESRSMAEAARRMADDARAVSAQQDDEAWRAAALMGEVQGANPAHIRREVERATHAIGALHQQMKSIEEALASQSAALDDAAERAEARARTIAESLRVEREALQGLVASIEEDGGRAMNLVAMRPGDMEKTQRTLDALKSQSDAIERTVEAAGVRLNAIAAEIQQALRQAKPGDAQSLTDGARASVREAAHDAIGAIGETEAATRARLFDGEFAGEAEAAAPAAEPLADDEAAELRRRNLAGLRRQMDNLRRGEEEPSEASASLQIQTQTPPQPGQGLAARLAGGAAVAGAGLGGLAATAAAKTGEAVRSVGSASGGLAAEAAARASGAGEAVAETASGLRAGASDTLSRLAQAFGETAEEAEKEVKALDGRAGESVREAVRVDLGAADLGGTDFADSPKASVGAAAPGFSGLTSPPAGAEQPVTTWDVLGDFDASLVESEPLDRDAAALAAQQAAARTARAAAPPEVPSTLADTEPPPVFEIQDPDPGPAPLFGDPTPPRAMSFDLNRLAPLADLSIPSPLLSGGAPIAEPPAPPAAPASPVPPPARVEAVEAPVQAEAVLPAPPAPTPLFQPIAAPAAGEPAGEAARGWLGAAAPGDAPAGGLDSFGERREVEAAPAASGPPRPAIVWRQPETPLFGARGAARPKPLDWDKVALGLNFPVSEEDAEAEEALYEVSIDHQIGALIQASEDMLAVLVDLRLYMEDHAPRIAPPEAWRAWLDGRVSVESQPVVEIGPQEALNRVRDLIDHDPAVERLAVSFAGRFEDLVRRALDEAEDPGVVTRLLDTRTGRAYAMVACAGGRVD